MKAVTVTTASTVILTPGNYPFAHLFNNGSATIFALYDGDSTTVTTTLGMPIVAGGNLNLNNDGGGKNPFINGITAIVASGTENLRVQGGVGH